MLPAIRLLSSNQSHHFLLLAINFDGFGSKFRGTFTVTIDIVFEAVVANVHLTEACEDLLGAVVKIRCDVVLQFLDELLCRFAVGALAASLAPGKRIEDTVLFCRKKLTDRSKFEKTGCLLEKIAVE